MSNNSIKEEEIEKIIKAAKDIISGFRYYSAIPERIILRESKYSQFLKETLEKRLNPNKGVEIVISDNEEGYVIDVDLYSRLIK